MTKTEKGNSILLRKRGGHDEFYTPEYAIEPLKKYIINFKPITSWSEKRKTIVWCPFDKEDSKYVKLFREWGLEVIHSHIDEGKDFFTYAPKKWDFIISNPPLSKKTEVLKRLYELMGKRNNVFFAMLLPLTSLEGIERNKLYKKHGLNLIVLNKRVNFIEGKSNYFNSSYFCSRDFISGEIHENIYPYNHQIVFEELEE